MARKLRKGKVSPLEPGEQIKKRKAAERKVARNDAKDTAPPKRKKAKAKAKAKPKTKAKAKAKVGTPKIASALGIASRAGPAVLASIAAAAGGVKLLGAGFSYATRGGKVRKADSKLLARQERLSKAVGKQPGPVGEFSEVSGRKARKKVTEQPVSETDIMGGGDQYGYLRPDQIPNYPKPTIKKLTVVVPSKRKKSEVGEVKKATPAAIGYSSISTSGKTVTKKAETKKPEVKAVTADSPGPKKEQAPVKAKKAAKKAANAEKSDFASSTREAIRTGTKAHRLTASAKRLRKPLVATMALPPLQNGKDAPRNINYSFEEGGIPYSRYKSKGGDVVAKKHSGGRFFDNLLRGLFPGALEKATGEELTGKRKRK